MTFRVATASWTMQRRRWNKWSFIALPIRAARPQCVVLEYFSAANFGSRYLGQASKKASLGSGQLSQQPFARLMRSISPACIRQPKRRSLLRHFAAHPCRVRERVYGIGLLHWGCVKIGQARFWHDRYRLVVRTLNRKREQQGRIVDGSEANVEDQTQTTKSEQTSREIAARKDG